MWGKGRIGWALEPLTVDVGGRDWKGFWNFVVGVMPRRPQLHVGSIPLIGRETLLQDCMGSWKLRRLQHVKCRLPGLDPHRARLERVFDVYLSSVGFGTIPGRK